MSYFNDQRIDDGDAHDYALQKQRVSVTMKPVIQFVKGEYYVLADAETFNNAEWPEGEFKGDGVQAHDMFPVFDNGMIRRMAPAISTAHKEDAELVYSILIKQHEKEVADETK